MSRPVLQVARAGEDLATAPVYKRTLDSSKNHLKILTSQQGEIVIPASAGGITRNYVVIEHALGYKPYVDVYCRDDGDTIWKKAGCNLDIETVGVIQGENETVITFYVWDIYAGASSEHTIEYKYLIYVDPAQDVWSS